MIEDEARALVSALVGPGAIDRLEQFAAMVIAENDRQNLIARSTIPAIWSRHILDSIQLLRWAGNSPGRWLDVGTGGGFPGLVVGLSGEIPMTLAEPRRRRADFLKAVVDQFELHHIEVVQRSAEHLDQQAASVISARAVAPLDDLFRLASHCSTSSTDWILPRGSGAPGDVEIAQRSWHGVFHVEQSLTDPTAGIVVATQVSRR